MAKLEFRQIDAPYGAEVVGWDPATPIDDDTAAQLQAAYDDHGLLLFRDLDGLTFEVQQGLVDVLCRADQVSMDAEGASETGNLVSNQQDSTSAVGRLNFHADAMWSDDPFRLVSLYAVSVAPDAAPTTFASMENAWRTLPADLRDRVDGLHVQQGEGQQVRDEKDLDEYAFNPAQADRGIVTPIGWQHPTTGRTVLFTSEQQTRSVVELDRDASDALLADLFAHLYAPANVYEHHWRDGDLVAWDNLAVQHGRPYVGWDSPARTLRRAVFPAPWLWSVVYDIRPAAAGT
jgi:alpha-ketoglutarate-dependent taurine dioxygenase